MHNFTPTEVQIIEAMLSAPTDTFQTYRYIKMRFKDDVRRKKRVWACIKHLENLGLITCIGNNRNYMVHKVKFDKNFLREKYNIEFTQETEDIWYTEEKKDISISDLEDIIKDAKINSLNGS